MENVGVIVRESELLSSMWERWINSLFRDHFIFPVTFVLDNISTSIILLSTIIFMVH